MPVIVSSVDTASTTKWMIATQLRWLRARCAMTMRQLANWFAASIRLSQKWSARIDRDELVKRMFAK